MDNSQSVSYKEAGVDITAGYRAVELMKAHVKRTSIPGVLGGLGGFGGLFAPDLADMKEPVLVSGTDGVGTKLKLAFLMDRHDTIGIDCVAMCVNDIVCSGAKPLFFLDYVAVGKNVPEQVADIVAGVAEGCVQAGCALIGGETAEMPGFYTPGEYDVAGFAVGMVDRSRMLDPQNVCEGDVLVGLPSSGFHSNGFSLVRKVFDVEHCDLNEVPAELGRPLGEALLEPTRIYVKPAVALTEAGLVHACCHITGGGFFENVPRALPAGLCASIEKAKVPVLPLFRLIQQRGDIPERDMFNTFNMGVGMVFMVPAAKVDAAVQLLCDCGEAPVILGEVIRGEGVKLW